MTFGSLDELNAYLASDPMVQNYGIIGQLGDLGAR